MEPNPDLPDDSEFTVILEGKFPDLRPLKNLSVALRGVIRFLRKDVELASSSPSESRTGFSWMGGEKEVDVYNIDPKHVFPD